ncbi:hypothetical protein D8Z77_18270 [Brevibacillus laterosporus]|nr:hypothetical protein D8Z77_18270 [Brevibacillus laterosporus]
MHEKTPLRAADFIISPVYFKGAYHPRTVFYLLHTVIYSCKLLQSRFAFPPKWVIWVAEPTQMSRRYCGSSKNGIRIVKEKAGKEELFVIWTHRGIMDLPWI